MARDPYAPRDWRQWPLPGLSKDAANGAEKICKEAIQRSGTDVCSLAFSGGKDSVAAYITLKAFFREVVPVYWYLVPNLGFIERSMEYYERLFGNPIHRMPHPTRYFLFSNFMFQPPSRIAAMDYIIGGLLEGDDGSMSHGTHLYTMDGLWAEARKVMGLDKEGRTGAMHATGIRASDSPVRGSLFRKHGGFAPNGLLFYPVITWKLDDIEAALDARQVMLPTEYQWLGRSFDGVMRRYLAPIREHFPEDYAKIKADYPLCDLEFFRAERVSGLANIKPLHRLVGRGQEKPREEEE